MTTLPDEALDLAEIQRLLESIPGAIGAVPNRVRSTMNGFVISVGSYGAPLLGQAMGVAGEIGLVSVDVGKTACRVPLATESIAKRRDGGGWG